MCPDPAHGGTPESGDSGFRGAADFTRFSGDAIGAPESGRPERPIAQPTGCRAVN